MSKAAIQNLVRLFRVERHESSELKTVGNYSRSVSRVATMAKKLSRGMLAALLAISLMIPMGALQPQEAWADEVEGSTGSGTVDDVTLEIKAGAATLKENTTNTYKFPHLTVVSNSSRPIKGITIQFTSAITTADHIDLNGVGKFQRYAGSKAGNVSINVPEGATADEWAEYLRENLEITLDGSTTKSLRMIASFDPVSTLYDYNATNGHYYETVRTRVNWETAYEICKTKKYMGMQGYLVTITSQQEHDYVYTMIAENCWMGATSWDPYTSPVKNTYADFYKSKGITIPGTTHTGSTEFYYWVSGPEAGKIVSYGPLKGQVAAPDPEGGTMFTNWASGEPNNSSGEMCAHFYTSVNGQWNDYANNNQCFYVIEYGGMPGDDDSGVDTSGGNGDANVDVDVYVKVDINIDPSGKTLTTESSDVYVGQPLNIRENVNGGDVETIIGRDSAGKFITEPATPDRTYYQLKEGGNRNNPDHWIKMDAEPTHVGTYKVVSTCVFQSPYEQEDGQKGGLVEYVAGESVFRIRPLEIDVTKPAPSTPTPGNPEGAPAGGEFINADGSTTEVAGRGFAKLYDGTTNMVAGAVNIADATVAGAQAYLTYEHAEFVSKDAGQVELKLTGVKLAGKDAADYKLKGLKSDGTLTVTGAIKPRTLEVTSTYVNDLGTEVTSWITGIPFFNTAAAIGSNANYKHNAGAFDASKVTGSDTDGQTTWPVAWPANLLAPGDTLSDVLGSVTYTPATAGGMRLNRADPAIGTYLLTPNFSKVSRTSAGFVTQDGNYVLSFVKGKLGVTARPSNVINKDNPIVIETTVTPDGGDDPVTKDDLKEIVDKELGGDPDPNNPDDPRGKIPAGVEPVITITKGGTVQEEIDPTEPGEYKIVVTYPDPDGTDIEVEIEYVIGKDPSPSPAPNMFGVSTKLKGATSGASITPSQSVRPGANVDINWTVGPNAYVALVEVDGKVVSPTPADYTFANINGNHEIVVTLANYPVLPGQTSKGYYTVTVNKYGGANGVVVSPSAVLNSGANGEVTWNPEPGYLVTSVLVDGVAVSADVLASGKYAFPDIAANHVVDVYFAPVSGVPTMSQTDLNVTTKIVGGPGSITGGTTIARGDSYTVAWEPVIQTTPDYTSPDYAVYEVANVEVNGKTAAGGDDRDLELTNIRENKDVVVTVKPVLYNVSVLKYGAGEVSNSRTFYKGQRYEHIFGVPADGSHISYIEIDGVKYYDERDAATTAVEEEAAQSEDVAASAEVSSAADVAPAADDATATDEAPAASAAATDTIIATSAVPTVEKAADVRATEPVFEPEVTDAKQHDQAALDLDITGISNDHRVVVYFAEDGKTANPDTVKDEDHVTVVPGIEGGPGEITGGGIINVGEDPTPEITWTIPDGYVPDGIWIDDVYYPLNPDDTSFNVPAGLDPNVEHTVKLEVTKRVPGDEELPVRDYPVLDTTGAGTVKQFMIYTELTGGPGTISASVQVVEGSSHTVTWTVGEIDGVKYRVAKVIIDGVEHPELLNATEYTFDDIAGAHTIQVILEPIPEPEAPEEPSVPAEPQPSEPDENPTLHKLPSTQGTTATKEVALAPTGDPLSAAGVMLVVVALAGAGVLALARRKEQL